VRAIALFGAGSAAIHQLRYAIGYGDGASHALGSHPHGYLAALLPGVATVAIVALAATLIRLARRGSAGTTRMTSSLPALWLASALALATIFGIQETLEGASAVSGGGWIGIALAVPAGLLVALALGGADAAEVRVRGAALRLNFAGAGRIGIRAASAAPPRLLDLRTGARAPPALT
jgi:hypothetical protein